MSSRMLLSWHRPLIKTVIALLCVVIVGQVVTGLAAVWPEKLQEERNKRLVCEEAHRAFDDHPTLDKRGFLQICIADGK